MTKTLSKNAVAAPSISEMAAITGRHGAPFCDFSASGPSAAYSMLLVALKLASLMFKSASASLLPEPIASAG